MEELKNLIKPPWDPLRDERLDIPPKPKYTPRMSPIITWSSLEPSLIKKRTTGKLARELFIINVPIQLKPDFEEIKTRIKTIFTENLKITPIDIEEFKDPESDETQIIVTVPVDPNVEDPFEELDKLHARISRFDKTLATKIIILPADPTE